MSRVPRIWVAVALFTCGYFAGTSVSEQRHANLPVAAYEGCTTDSDCLAQCIRELPLNRPESECEDFFGEGWEDENGVFHPGPMPDTDEFGRKVRWDA